MVQIVAATFKDGVFKPDQQPALSESARVRLLVEPLDDESAQRADSRDSWAALRKLWNSSTFNSNGDRLTRDQLHDRR
jgi:predicted DNA-binding antitoxin AbrB/MazE fold protein